MGSGERWDQKRGGTRKELGPEKRQNHKGGGTRREVYSLCTFLYQPPPPHTHTPAPATEDGHSDFQLTLQHRALWSLKPRAEVALS